MDMLNAFTYEADDAAAAIRELKAQLDFEHTLKKHSAAFVTCSYDFVESGIITDICAALPFDVAGCTTFSNGVNAESGNMLLCLSVLTADDCVFSSALSGPLDAGNLDASVAAAWQEAAASLHQPPVFALAFSPMIRTLGGELLLTALDNASAGTPLFGTTACDYDTATYANSFVIHNGECHRDRLAVLLIAGDIQPRYIVTPAAGERSCRMNSTITSSEGSLLKTVDGKTAEAFMQSIGLTKGAGVEGLSCVPFLVDYHDSTQPIARAVYMITEEGYAVCGGAMPEGSSIGVSSMSPSQIMATAESSIRQITGEAGLRGLILFPCLGRNMVMAVDPQAETVRIRELVGSGLPWHLAYSGGEICPLRKESGELVNRFHNFTFIACAF